MTRATRRRELSSFLLGRQRYRVKSRAVIVPRMGGGEVYLYRNSLLPADASPAIVEMLLRSGAIYEIEETR
ncbi:MAG: hypothetical protein KJ659_09100 [Actinobacteria bacterium]|nr:hypothetical protein [Actinomycetota bacterium]MBU1607822.1 hypothetical protein [Actinomycetota bacterium]MBU2314676.1 hypothetical protein [Actinomycetota bacterium]MBU2385637.1 hypothetical protein [Actinomycetota bacterium]